MLSLENGIYRLFSPWQGFLFHYVCNRCGVLWARIAEATVNVWILLAPAHQII